jgi:ATP synthase protein I
MNGPQQNTPETGGMLERVRLVLRRHRQAEGSSRPSVARQLGQIGILGWIIVAPILLGVALGRWLDHTFGSGVFWTAPLLILGAALGFWSAWRWMHAE